SIEVEVKSITGKEGKENQGLKAMLFYDDGIEELYMMNAQLIQILHRSDLDKATTEKAVFTLKDQDLDLQPLVNQTDPKLLQLVLNKPLVPGISYHIKIPPRIAVQKQKLPGSLRTIIFDNQPPKLILIEALNENELLVSFNEALDPILSMVTA